MEVSSTHAADVPGGVCLNTRIDDLAITCYVVVSEPDLEKIADIVPAEVFASGVDVHANAVSAGEAEDQILAVIENMNPGDAAVFMCLDAIAYGETLAALGADGGQDDEPLN